MSSPDPIRSLDEPFDQPPDPTRRRLFALGAALGIGILGLSGQLWRLQVFGGASYRELADNNRFRLSRLEPARGVIYDRNGDALARNRPSYVVAVVPADLPREPDRAGALRRLSRLVGVPVARIEAALGDRRADPFSPVVIATGVETRLAYTIEERHAELPGVQVLVKPVREYVDGRLVSHTIGYVGKLDADEFKRLGATGDYALDDQIGKMGLELVREKELRGRPGRKRSEVDSTGRELRVLGTDPAKPGRNLHLTIDLPLQREITRLLAEYMPAAEAASAVALDPRDGQVLALVHLPSFDNNMFSRELDEAEFKALIDDPNKPLIDGAIAAAYPPGAIFEIVTALAGLHTGVIKPETKIDCTGALVIPDRLAPGGVQKIPCWTVHGPQDCASALANSCNVFFYQVGGGDPRGSFDGLDIDRLADWATRLGFASQSGIELPNETEGLVPTKAWKRRAYREDWFTGDTYNAAIGQGYVTATPLQVANLVATVANGGRLFKPQVVARTTDERGQVVDGYKPILVRDVGFDPAKLKSVQNGLRYGMLIGRTENGTSFTGTSWQSDLRDLATAGKTGSPEWGTPDTSGRSPTHGWFAGYAPFDQPQLALSVFLKRGRGAQDAARIARDVFAFYFGVAEA
jgi:penicillin-binding protein 2